MMEKLASTLVRQIRLGCVATRIEWKGGRVDVTFFDSLKRKARTVSGQTVVIAVPLGVLAAPADAPGAIAIDPPIASHARAVELMAMGTVVKLVLRFEQAFWREEKLAERLAVRRLDQMSFIQSSGKLEFPVWWSMYPIDAPLLIGWRGGPVATEMSRLPKHELERRAIASLAEIFAMKPASLRRRLVATFNHDWINDPFSRGVYSYSRVGGANACVTLSRPVHDTIWFAGEAADRLGRTGTVHGAIGSGWRAADEILRR
jgi:monoamine oxidase